MLTSLKNIYLNSFLYDKKISKPLYGSLQFKPSTFLISSIVKIHSVKLNINEFAMDEVWTNKQLNTSQIKKLNNFFWIFSLDLKSSDKDVQKIIKNWIVLNHKYNSNSWEFNTTAKRIISWLSNTKLTYEGSSFDYKNNFDTSVKKQSIHLLNQINETKNSNDKLLGVTAVVLFALCYNKPNKIFENSLEVLKKILNLSLIHI